MCSTCDCNQGTTKLGQKEEEFEQDVTGGNKKLRPCRRCGTLEPYIIIDKVHIECKSCFLESCNKKIRSTIGRSRLLANNDPVLVAYSGGPSSCALLDLIKTSMSPINKRDQKFRPSILHVDMQVPCLRGNKLTDATVRYDQLKSTLDSLHSAYPDWPIYWTSFEVFFKQKQEAAATDCQLFSKYNGKLDVISISNEPARICLEKHLSSMDLTDKQQFVQDSLVELINTMALEINASIPNDHDRFKYVFSASSSTKLATNLLVDTILGRGATLRSIVDICDSRPSIPIVRPMRDFSKKEIAFYLRGKNIEPVIETNLLTFADRKSSIQTVTESFLSKLYVDYPSTYSTLLRTGNKLL